MKFEFGHKHTRVSSVSVGFPSLSKTTFLLCSFNWHGFAQPLGVLLISMVTRMCKIWSSDLSALCTKITGLLQTMLEPSTTPISNTALYSSQSQLHVSYPWVGAYHHTRGNLSVMLSGPARDGLSMGPGWNELRLFLKGHPWLFSPRNHCHK